MNGLSEAIIVCKGELTDPSFLIYLAGVKERLQKILETDKETFHVSKLERWNSVRVTFHLPPSAAHRLRALAEQQPHTLHTLGIQSVQVDGNQTISVLLRALDRTQSVSDESRVESGLGSSCASSDNNGAHPVEAPPTRVYADEPQTSAAPDAPIQSWSPQRVAPNMCHPVAVMEQMVANPNIVSNSPLLVNLLRSSSPGAGASSTQPCQTTAPSLDNCAFGPPLGVQSASGGFGALNVGFQPTQMPSQPPVDPAPKRRKRNSRKKPKAEAVHCAESLPLHNPNAHTVTRPDRLLMDPYHYVQPGPPPHWHAQHSQMAASEPSPSVPPWPESDLRGSGLQQVALPPPYKPQSQSDSPRAKRVVTPSCAQRIESSIEAVLHAVTSADSDQSPLAEAATKEERSVGPPTQSSASTVISECLGSPPASQTTNFVSRRLSNNPDVSLSLGTTMAPLFAADPLRVKQMMTGEIPLLVNGRDNVGQLAESPLVNGQVSHLPESLVNEHRHTLGAAAAEALEGVLSVQIPSVASLAGSDHFVRPSPSSLTSNSSSVSLWSGGQLAPDPSGNVLSPVPSSSAPGRRRNRRKADHQPEMDDAALNSGDQSRPAKRKCAQNTSGLVRHSLGLMDAPARARQSDSSRSSSRSSSRRKTRSRTPSSVTSSPEPADVLNELRLVHQSADLRPSEPLVRNCRFSPNELAAKSKRPDNGASAAAFDFSQSSSSPGLLGKVQATGGRARRLKR